MADIKKLPLFVKCVIQNFPFIEEDFDALTNYQLISKVVKYLNKIITSQNSVIGVANDLQKAFQELHDYVENYFDNLDVQEEINNKLDAMVEDGTLPEIITSYIQSNVAWTFDTVSEMQSATNLIAGSYTRTLGYYTINDGGGSLYYITDTGTPDGGNVIAVGNLFANLVIENESINVTQFGAKGDSTTDDSDAINMALATGVSNVNFVTGKTYMVRGYELDQGDETQSDFVSVTGLVLKDNQDVNLNGATVKCITNSRKSYNIFTLAEVDNVKLHNGTIIGDRQTHTGNSGEWGYGVAIKFATNVTLENLNISECWGDGICTNHNGDSTQLCENLYIRNCICKSNYRQGFSHQNGRHTIVEDCEFSNTGDDSLHTSPSDGVDIEPGTNSNKVIDVLFNRCTFANNYNSGIQIKGDKVDGIDNIDGVVIMNCKFKNNYATIANADINIGKSYNVIVKDCEFSNAANNTQDIISINCSNSMLFEGNEIYNARVVVKSGNMSNSYIKILNNHFISDINQQYNACIQTGSGGAESSNNTLIIEDNIFDGTPSLTLSAWVQCTSSHKFEKLIVKRNKFKYGNKNISTDASNIIENNNFIAPSNYSIILNTGNSDQVTTLKGNVFEEVGYNLSAGGAVNNSNNNNIIAQDNIIYSNCTTKADNQTKTYDNTSRLLQITSATGGVSLDDNNNFFSNTYA